MLRASMGGERTRKGTRLLRSGKAPPPSTSPSHSPTALLTRSLQCNVEAGKQAVSAVAGSLAHKHRVPGAYRGLASPFVWRSPGDAFGEGGG